MWCRVSNVTPSQGRASVARDHLVDQPVLERLLGLEKAVALHVAFVRQRPGPAHGPPLRNENRPADAGRGGYLQVSLERLQQRVAANVLGGGRLGRCNRLRDADHRVARHEHSQLLLGRALAPGRAARDHEVADIRSRVEHAQLGVVF